MQGFLSMLEFLFEKLARWSWISVLSVTLFLAVSNGTSAKCSDSLNQIAAGLPATSDAILHMQQLREAMEKCGDTQQIDLIVNQHALADAIDADDVSQVAGVWVGDVWLPVDAGVVIPIADVLTISGSNIHQEVIRWWDPENAETGGQASEYILRLASAKLVRSEAGKLVVTEFKPSAHVSEHNPYQAFKGPEPATLRHPINSFMLINLGKITRIRIAGDRLLLVDGDARVRSYVRHNPELVKGGHGFFLAAEISAARYWPCFMRVLSGNAGDDDTRKLLQAAALTANDIVKLQAAIDAGLDQLQRTPTGSDEATRLEQEIKSASSKRAALAGGEKFIAAAMVFSAEDPPAFCQQN